MVFKHNLRTVKVLILLIAWTIAVSMLTVATWPTAKLYLQTIRNHSSIELNSKRDNNDILKPRCEMSEIWYDSIGPTDDLPPKKELFSVRKKLRPTPHFRDLFQGVYSSTVDTGADNVTGSDKYLIYRCDAAVFCGGWSDRVKGMMAAYLIANLTGRTFKAEMLSPVCDIQQFIVPNLVNWTLPVSFHKRISPGPNVQQIDLRKSDFAWDMVRCIDLDRIPQMKAKYVYYRSSHDFMTQFKASTRYAEQLSWMHGLSRAEINAVIFKRLFKLSPYLNNQLNSFLANNLDASEYFICAHVRIGRNPSLPHDSVDRVRLKDIPKVWDVLRYLSHNLTYKIFLMSDSEDVISSAKQQSFKDKLIFTSGKVVHAEKSVKASDKEKCEGIEKVVFEQFILMHCDALLISNSGISRIAAYVRGSDEGLYCLMDDGRILPCEGGTLQELYRVKS